MEFHGRPGVRLLLSMRMLRVEALGVWRGTPKRLTTTGYGELSTPRFSGAPADGNGSLTTTLSRKPTRSPRNNTRVMIRRRGDETIVCEMRGKYGGGRIPRRAMSGELVGG